MVDLVLKNVNYLDVKERCFKKGNISINKGIITGINDNEKGIKEVNYNNKYLVPGFIDGHIHLESSIISPDNFAKLVSPHGTTTVVTDPHEIANVCGINGIKWMMDKTCDLPIDVYFMVSSCVPATPFDESAYTLTSKEVEECFKLDSKRILGLAEMMNYPGVIYGDEDILKKIKITKDLGKRVDGHAPGLSGEDLVKYISAGIESDHECSSLEEAIEKLEVAKKLNKDFYIMIREGTAAKNLNALYELMNKDEYKEFTTFATDDKHPEELASDGHIDSIIRKALKLDVNPVDVYITASYNAAKYFKLDEVGSIEVGKKADLVVLNDINSCDIKDVYKKGLLITKNLLDSWMSYPVDSDLDKMVRNSIHMDTITEGMINREGKLPIIGLVPGEILTKYEGEATGYDLDNDILKVIVIESHKGTNHIGVAYLKGLGLKEGAIGTTVAHDSHYMIICGTNDKDIVKVANELAKMQGGKMVVINGKVINKLALPIANLISDESPNKVIKTMRDLKNSVKVNEGIDPFMNLSFVSLAVIGDIRLLPGGVFDVKNWKFFE